MTARSARCRTSPRSSITPSGTTSSCSSPYSAFPFKQAGRYDLKFYVQYYVKADGAKLGRTDYRVLTYTHR